MDNTTDPDTPRQLRNPLAVTRRRALLNSRHMRPLTRYKAEVEAKSRGFVPDFDPLDGGIHARLLFLFEKPGPKTFFSKGGSGFISRDNDDPSAQNCKAAMIAAGIPREGTIIWNTVPWWNQTIQYTGDEMRAGASELPGLLRILPDLRGIVFVGKSAAKHGASAVASTGLRQFATVHTSNQARNGPASREDWKRIPEIWASAWRAVA